MDNVVNVFMECGEKEGLEELYKITNNEIIRICIGWLEDRTEWNSDYANSMYEDIMNFIWDKYNLKKYTKSVDKI